MNFLAKHFFDYQSFINLPHTAVQMHKTPPSQAGSDPSAAWAPKDLHIAGKNQAAPAARANRNYHGDQRTGSHRHGRPSKLEFRNWGERHGELREEKIVPHKDHWMEAAQNGHHHHHPRGGSLDSTSAILHGRSATATADHFPNEYFASRALKLQQQFQQQQQQQQQKQRSLDAAAGIGTGGPPRSPPIRALLILTVTPHLDFVSVTVKALRGLERGAKDPLVKLCLYDGHRLLEERGPQKPSSSGGRSSTHEELIHMAASADPEAVASGERQLGHSFLLKAPSPTRLPFCHAIISFYTRTGNEEPTNFRIDNSSQLLGTCLIGPSGTVTRSSSHWRQMIKKMGVPVAMWHDLLLGAHNQPPASASHCGGRNSPLEQRRRTATVAATSTAKHSATSSHAASSTVGGGKKPIDDGSQERRDSSSGVPVPGTAPKKESYPRKNGNESVLEMVV